MRPPCLVCGTRPHDGAYHEEFRRRRARWVNLLDARYPTTKGQGFFDENPSTLGGPRTHPSKPKSVVEKPNEIKGRFRTAGRVSPGTDFLTRPRERTRAARRDRELPGTLAWARLQGHLALAAPLRQVRGRVRMEGEGNL